MIEGVARGPGGCLEADDKTQGPYRGRGGAAGSWPTVAPGRFAVPFTRCVGMGLTSSARPVECRAGSEGGGCRCLWFAGRGHGNCPKRKPPCGVAPGLSFRSRPPGESSCPVLPPPGRRQSGRWAAGTAPHDLWRHLSWSGSREAGDLSGSEFRIGSPWVAVRSLVHEIRLGAGQPAGCRRIGRDSRERSVLLGWRRGGAVSPIRSTRRVRAVSRAACLRSGLLPRQLRGRNVWGHDDPARTRQVVRRA